MVVTTALSAGLAWSMGSELLFDAWQPHAMILPFWCLLVMCWALAAGDLLMAPFVVGMASLLVQTHLSFVYVVAIIGWRRRRRADVRAVVGAGRRAGTPSGLRPHRAVDRRGGGAGWCQPLSDQVAGEGNLGHLLASSGRRDTSAPGWPRARFVASVVALPPWWTRPGFSRSRRATGVVDDRRAGRGRRERGGGRRLARPRRRCRVLAAVDRRRAALALPADRRARRPRRRGGRGLWCRWCSAHRRHRHQPAPDALAVADLGLRAAGVVVTPAEWQPVRRVAVPIGLAAPPLWPC